ncbi:MAG: hypothetical protein JHD28_08760 [Bacteroidia bacterium]|nr:hypothetical protein [Bacteroidia bacterium]
MNHLNNQDKFEKQLKEQFDSFEAKPNEALWENIAQNLPADNFEKSIASKLNTLQVEPSEGIWLAIEKHLPQISKYSKKLVYLWTFAVLTVGVIAGIFINKFTVEISQNNTLTHPKAFVWLDSAAVDHENLNSSTGFLTKTNNSKQQLALNTEKAENKAITEKAQHTYNQITSKKSANNKAITKSTNNQTNANSNRKPIIAAAIVIAPVIKGSATNNIVNNPIAKNDGLNNNALSSNNSGSNNNNNTAIAKNDEPINPVIAEQNKPKPVKAIDNTEPETKLETPAKVDSSTNTPNVKTTNAQQASENDYMGPSLKREKLTIIAYAGMGYSFMRYAEGTDKTNSAANINLREKTETTESEISGGFLVGYDITKRITLSSGIIMANFKQTMSFNLDTAKQQLGNYEENLIYYQDTILAGNNNVKSLKYSYTEIPIYVTYKILETPKFELAAQTGLGIGFLTGINTYVIAQNNVGVYEISNKNDYPAFKNTLFFTFQPQFTYNLSTPGVSIGFMPIIKTSLTNIVSDEKWLKQYPYNMSFNLFLRKRF